MAAARGLQLLSGTRPPRPAVRPAVLIQFDVPERRGRPFVAGAGAPGEPGTAQPQTDAKWGAHVRTLRAAETDDQETGA